LNRLLLPACLFLAVSVPAQTTAAPAAPALPAPTAAAPVSVSEYLATARKDALVEARQAGGDYRYGRFTGLPFIKEMEVKVRNEGLDLPRNRYTLELKPRGFGEGRASRLYNRAQIDQSGQRVRVLLNRALLERYLLTVDLLMRRSMNRIYDEMIAVAEDRIKVLDMRKYGEDFDLNKVVEAEADLTKAKALALDARKEVEVLEERIAEDMAPRTFSGLDTSGLVDVEKIIAEVESSTYAVDTGHVYLKYLDQGLDLAEKRFRLEQSEGRQILKSVSVSYDVGERLDEMERRDEGKDFDMAQAYILEATFRIPWLNSDNIDLNRRKEDFLSEKEDVAKNRRELRIIMQKDIQDIGSLVSQYRYLMARENQVDAQASLKKYMQMTGVDPLILLSIKSSSLKNRLKIEEVKYGIMMNYIKVMDATGRLSRAPIRNHLSAAGEALPE